LNALFSALLLVYLFATAGLGLFWVANQQLPVFDWHYVFGYALLLLVAVHLGFNLRALWLHLKRLRPGAPGLPGRDAESPRAAAAGWAPPADRQNGRRPLLAVFGALSLGALAYWMGRRHGRTELILSPAAAGGTDEAALAAVDAFHAHSSHARAGLLHRAASADWGPAPPPFKAHAGEWRLALPDPAAAVLRPCAEGPGRGCADLPMLSALLWHSAGISERRGGLILRTAPSSGALFATELYVMVADVPGLAPGLWRYAADVHELWRGTVGELPPQLRGELLPAGVQAAVWATALFRRSGHKYGDRTYRYVLADLGHVLENLRACARAAAWPLSWQLAFDGSRAALALGLDEAEEGVLACALLGASGPSPPQAMPRPAHDAAASALQGRAAEWLAGQSSAASAALGITDAMYRLSSLRRATRPAPGPVAPGLPGPEPGTGPASAGLSLPAAPATDAPVWPLIARRRSVRRFAARPVALSDLARCLRPFGALAPAFSTALRVYLLARAVEALPPGVWRYDALQHRLQLQAAWDADQLRRQSQAAALDQEVIGNAPLVLAFCMQRTLWTRDPLGPARGYRHAFLEAGMWGERLYLAAQSLGLGVCGVGAFFDDEAAALLGLETREEAVIHLAALGHPA
jgi:SagB-type dehydrogenase family enzyme